MIETKNMKIGLYSTMFAFGMWIESINIREENSKAMIRGKCASHRSRGEQGARRK